MFIEDSNVIKAPNHFILPFYGPPLIALLTFHTSISLKWGKIETFDKNRDLKNTQIVKKKGLYKDPGLKMETLVATVRKVLQPI